MTVLSLVHRRYRKIIAILPRFVNANKAAERLSLSYMAESFPHGTVLPAGTACTVSSSLLGDRPLPPLEIYGVILPQDQLRHGHQLVSRLLQPLDQEGERLGGIARAGVQQDLGNFPMALMDLDEAIRLDKSRSEAYLMRGQIYLAQGKKSQAKENLEEAVNLGFSKEELSDLLEQCK